MRHTYTHREEVRAKGAVARTDMVRTYSMQAMAAEVATHTRRIVTSAEFRERGRRRKRERERRRGARFEDD
jgi:hypothetical protein